MQTFKSKISLILVLIAVMAISAAAQPPMDGPKAKEKIAELKKIKLLEILSLDEETSVKFLSKYTVIEKKIGEKKMMLDKAVEELHEALKKSASKDEIAEKTQKMIQLQQEFQKEAMDSRLSMKSVLNDVEFAKFIVFEHKFRQEFAKLMFERMRERRGQK